MATFSFPWNPFDPEDPGPCIRFSVTRFADDIEYGKRIGLEYADPPNPTALIDTGSPFTIITRVLARNCNLSLTNPVFRFRTMSGSCSCEEYCGSVSFPGSGLPPIRAAQLLANETFPETNYSCILGRNILKWWDIRFDGRARVVTITAPDSYEKRVSFGGVLP
jgi:hypothetical protein